MMTSDSGHPGEQIEAACGRSDAVETLGAMKFHGMSPLLYSVAIFDEDLALQCVPHCTEQHMSERAPGGGGYTALHFASAGNMHRLTAALLSHKADPELRCPSVNVITHQNNTLVCLPGQTS